MSELALFKIAQKVTDEVIGKGTYVKSNKFDPSKGETHRYSDGCICSSCTKTWNDALIKALDRGDRKKRKKKKNA